MDPLTVVMLIVFAALIFFMFRNSRKRQRDAANLQEKVVPGATVMTNFGMYGTISSIDTEDNSVQLQIAPGTTVKVHRQSVARVVEPTVPEVVHTEPTLNAESTGTFAEPTFGEPEFGERLDEKPAPGKKHDE